MKFKWTKTRWFSWLQSNQPKAIPPPLSHGTSPPERSKSESPVPALAGLSGEPTASNTVTSVPLSPQITLTNEDSSGGESGTQSLDIVPASVAPPPLDPPTSPSSSNPPRSKSSVLSSVKGVLGIASSALSGTAFAGVPRVCLQIITTVEQLGENDEQFLALEEVLRRLHVTILQPAQDARALYGFEVLGHTQVGLDMLEKSLREISEDVSRWVAETKIVKVIHFKRAIAVPIQFSSSEQSLVL